MKPTLFALLLCSLALPVQALTITTLPPLLTFPDGQPIVTQDTQSLPGVGALAKDG